QIQTLSLHDALPIYEPPSFTDQNNTTVSRFQPVKNQKPQKNDVSGVIQQPVTKANGDGGSSGNTQNKIAAPGIREENKDGSKSIDRKSTRLNSSHDQ